MAEREVDFVVVLKVHFWDAFAERQLRRLISRAGPERVVVLVDETSGAVGPIAHDRVMRFTNADLLALGLADAYEKGGLIWWCTDYPHYHVLQHLPGLDYYVFVEYDANILVDVHGVVTALQREGVDYLALPTRESYSSWHWASFHERIYPPSQMRRSLNCISALSRSALTHLFARRLEMSADHEAGRLAFWPMIEVFVPTEVERAGFRSASLADYGDVGHYEWHPPTLESDLDGLGDCFVHPVLDQDRYIASVLKYEFDLKKYVLPGSRLWADLSRFPTRAYLPRIPGAFSRSVVAVVRKRLGFI